MLVFGGSYYGCGDSDVCENCSFNKNLMPRQLLFSSQSLSGKFYVGVVVMVVVKVVYFWKVGYCSVADAWDESDACISSCISIVSLYW